MSASQPGRPPGSGCPSDSARPGVATATEGLPAAPASTLRRWTRLTSLLLCLWLPAATAQDAALRHSQPGTMERFEGSVLPSDRVLLQRGADTLAGSALRQTATALAGLIGPSVRYQGPARKQLADRGREAGLRPVVESPWYLRTPFLGLWLVLSLATLWLALSSRIRRLQREREELLQQMEQRNRQLAECGGQLEGLGSMAHSINQQNDRDTLLLNLLQQVQSLVHGVDYACVLLFDDADQQLQVRSHAGMYRPVQLYLSPELAQRVLIDAAVAVATDVHLVRDALQAAEMLPLHQEDQAHALLALPLHLGGERNQGYMLLASRHRGDAFDKHDAVLLNALRELSCAGLEKYRRIEALQQAQQLLERAARFKGEFLATISHEIRTPMNAIIGFSRLGSDVSELDEARDFLRKIGNAGDILMALLDDVLDLSRIEAGRLALEQVDFNLRDELRGLETLFADSARDKGIALHLIVDDGLPECVRGDPLRLRQVLVNLIGNALKFTEQGFVRLSVAAEVGDSAGSDGELSVSFRVEDSGIGIEPERLNRLFEVFGQAETSTARQHGGSGLGLVIARQLVELMGGSLQVSSEPGKGSCFHFDVRIRRGEPSRCGSGSTAALSPSTALAGLRVLVVEDNRINQEVVARVLARVGVEVSLADSGAEALALVLEQDFHAVLMDIHMPGMDGYQTTVAMRRLPGCEQVPIIALTAHAVVGYRRRCVEAGMNDYLTKPFEPEALYAALLRWVRVEGDAASVAKSEAHSSGVGHEQPTVGEERWQQSAQSLPNRGPPAGMADPFAEEAPSTESGTHQADSAREQQLAVLSETLLDFDTAAALRYLGDDLGFYRRLLDDFNADFVDAERQLRDLLQAGESAEAARLVHSIKGVAATLGARAVAQSAAALEQAFGQERAEWLHALQAFEQALRQARECIHALPATVVAAKAEAMNQQQIDAALEALGRGLRQSDPTCESIWEALREHLQTDHAELVAELDRHLHSYDFEAAQESLEQLRVAMRGPQG